MIHQTHQAEGENILFRTGPATTIFQVIWLVKNSPVRHAHTRMKIISRTTQKTPCTLYEYYESGKDCSLFL